MMLSSFFSHVTSGNSYSLDAALAHHAELIKAKAKAKDLPNIEAAFIMKNHVGCCLHYGMFLFKELREAGYEAYISITLEENLTTGEKNDSHVSVCYVKDDEMFIADPVATVKGSTEKQYDIPLGEFKKKHGTIWLYDPYGENGDMLFFEGFMAHPLKTFCAD